MDHLITVEEVRALGRPISPQIDKEKLLSYIYETERLSIKPVIGDSLFSRILEKLDEQDIAADDPIKILLDGGEYTDAQGHYHMFSGLRMAMSYYVYAQYVMDGDFQLTRAGVVVKDGAYSSHVSSKERSDCYNNALTIADGFMTEVKGYIRFAFPDEYRRLGKILGNHSSAITVKRIG
jgi:hypothetical protein